MKLASCDNCHVVVDTDKMEPITYYMDEKYYRCPVCDTPEIVVKPDYAREQAEEVVGLCPECKGNGLFKGEGGYVDCSHCKGTGEE